MLLKIIGFIILNATGPKPKLMIVLASLLSDSLNTTGNK